MNKVKKALLGVAVIGALAGAPGPANAAVSPALTQLSEDIQSIDSITDVIAPIAIGSIAFMGGSLLVKRFIFS